MKAIKWFENNETESLTETDAIAFLEDLMLELAGNKSGLEKERDNYQNQLDNHVCSVNCQESFCLDDYQELQEELKKAKQEIELYKEKSKRSETMLRLVEEELESIVGEWNIQEAREQAERKLKEEEQDKESQTKLEANIEVNTNYKQ